MMSFDSKLEIGQVVCNHDIYEIFGVDTQQGIRTSRKEKYIVLVSKNYKNHYPDKWLDDYTILYTGVGKKDKGDQKLAGRNKTLENSIIDNKELFFFEMDAINEYTYRGKCKLIDEPKRQLQTYDDGSSRYIYLFPLKLDNKRKCLSIDENIKNVYEEQEIIYSVKLNSLSDKDVNEMLPIEYKRIPVKKRKPVIREGIKVYLRDKTKSKCALKKAEYKCEYDRDHHLFVRKNIDVFYTEPHHLVPMEFSERFPYSLDVEENIISLCSNCHNEIHYGRNRYKLVEKLYNERKEFLKDVGIEINLEELKAIYKGNPK